MVCLSGLHLISFAQNNILQFSTIHLPDQIAGSSLRMAVKDQAALLWFVTGEGLYRYDGNELLHFGLKTTPALPSLTITALQADGRGNLWIGFTNGAAKFDLRTWQITSLSANDWRNGSPQDRNIFSIGCTPDGYVYLGTYSGKLYVAGGNNDSGPLSQDASSNRLRLLMNLPFDKRSGRFNSILNIQEPFPGQLWIQTAAGQLVNLPILDSSKGMIYGKPAYYKPAETYKIGIRNVRYDRSGKCIYASDTSIYLADLKQLSKHRTEASHNPNDPPREGYVKKVPFPEKMTDNNFSPFYISGKTVAVISGSPNYPGNIYTFDFKNETWKLETPLTPIRFPGKIISGISEQRLSTFVCSGNAITRLAFNQSPIRTLLNGVNNNNSIRSVYKDSNYLYVGSYRDGFMRYDLQDGKSKCLSPMIVYSTLRWNNDSLLLASEGGGLYWYIPSANRFEHIDIKNGVTEAIDHPAQNKFATVLCKINNQLLLEGTYQGVFLIDPIKKTSRIVFTDSLSSTMQSLKINAIMPVQKHNANSYLIATNDGVFEANLNTGRVKYFIDHDSIAGKFRSAAVYSLFCRKGQVWMGTNGYGIQIADTSGKIRPSQWLNTRLSSQIIYQITSSGNSILIGSNNGLNVLSIKDSKLAQYAVFNGLPANEFNQSAVFSTEKQVYLGTINGLVVWNNIKTEPGLALFHTTINKQTIIDKHNQRREVYNFPYLPEDSQRIIIPPGTKYFSITFGKRKENRQLDYYYRLSSNTPWIKLGKNREISFIKTPPGKYKLHFAARSLNGKWMEDNHLIPMIVLPAFYQTLWFKIILGLIGIGFIWLIFRYREMQRNKERNLRMKIAGDLHDEVGSSLTQIWHQAQLGMSYREPFKENTAPEKKGKGESQFSAIADTSREALSMMSDMVWSIDARFDTMEELILRMKDYVYRLKNESGISLRFEVTGTYENRKVSQVIRQNLFLLFKEAINNAIKHGNGDPVIVNISVDGGQFVLQVINSCHDGGTLRNGTVQGGNGLLNMQRRVNEMHGHFSIENTAGRYILVITI